jgi:antirestriction protein ArdC
MPRINQDTPKARADVHQAVTDRIIAMLETAEKNNAEMPWCRPGVAHSRPTNALSKQRYRGINILSLWATADACNYRTGLWATYKQWQEIGAQVRKGEGATPIVFYKPLEVPNDKPDTQGSTTGSTGDGNDATRIIRMVRGYWGFNADQVDGFQLPDAPLDNLVVRLEHAEHFFANIGVPIKHGGARAFYLPAHDFIQMPEHQLFRDTKTSTATEGYYSVLGHEAGHASGAKHRLARDLSGRFGSVAYAIEELVAELTAANLCADLQITAQPREDHALYIKPWLQVLKGDKTAIFAAAVAANKAAEFLHSLQPTKSEALP